MELGYYQKESGKTAVYPNIGNNLWYPGLGLAGEAGELCNKIKKIYRDANGVLTDEIRQDLKKELGDIMWYVQQCATEAGLSLDEICLDNLVKLNSRLERGTLQGSGDDR